jgi:hypothetical protein
MIYRTLTQFLFIFLVSATVHCSLQAQSQSAVESLIPKPVSVATGDGMFTLYEQTTIYVEGYCR